MLVKMFSVFDNKSHVYYPPFTFQHLAQAVRAFVDLAQDRDGIISRHPEDYELVEVGVFDDSTGHVHAVERLNHGRASQHLARINGDQPVLFGKDVLA